MRVSDHFLSGFIMGLIIGAIIGIKSAHSKEPIVCAYSHGMYEYSTFNVHNSRTIHKNFEVDSLHYEVHIENTKSFTNVDDYIKIKGEHTMTYALECK